MKKEDLHFYLICPNCYQRDHMHWDNFKECVLDEQLDKKPSVGPTPPYRMEGEYPCPYGCGVQMLLFFVGTEEEGRKKYQEMFDKYFTKMPPDCCTFAMAGFTPEQVKKHSKKRSDNGTSEIPTYHPRRLW